VRKVVILCLLLYSVAGAGSLADARLSPQRSVLDSGLILLTSEQKALPMVTLSLLIDAGSRYDPEGREGLANLTARLLTYGTSKRTAIQISETLDSMGARLSTDASEELATVSLTVLKRDLDAGLNLLAEILSASVFPPEEIERQKQAVIASIRAKREDPQEIANVKFLEELFPKSAYGRPVEGTEDSVQRVDRKNLLDFYKRYYRPNRAILAVVGDASHEEMREKLKQAFQPWEKGPVVKEPPPSLSPGPGKLIWLHKNLTQANIVMGHEGVPRGHPDYYAIQVMNYILGGGGFSSRLMDSIRSERGLAYSVYSFFSAEKFAGIFQIGIQTKNETAEEAIRIAREEIRRIREEGVSEQELQEAKDYLTGSFPLRLDTNRRIADFLAHVEFFELGLDYPERYSELIRQVTGEDVLRVARKYLVPEKLIVVVLADQEKTKIQK